MWVSEESESPIVTQRLLRIFLDLGWDEVVLIVVQSWNGLKYLCAPVKLWKIHVNAKRSRLSRIAGTSENMEAMRQSSCQSPQRSARKYATTLELSARTVRQLLQLNSKFHSYKMMVVQKCFVRVSENRFSYRPSLLEVITENAEIFFSEELKLYSSGCTAKQNECYW